MNTSSFYRSIFAVALFAFSTGFCGPPIQCGAAVTAYLTAAQRLDAERFQSDLFFQNSADLIGDEIEYIELDIANTLVGSQPLTDFRGVRFSAASPFDLWQTEQQFGLIAGSESRMVLEPFATPTAVVYPIVDENPILIGTFTFDFGGLGLSLGDAIDLNVFGVDDGTPVRTTSVGLHSAGKSTLVNLDFSSPEGGAISRFTITAIPEPNVLFFFSVVTAGTLIGSRRRVR